MHLITVLPKLRRNPLIGIVIAIVLTAAAVLARMATPVTLSYVTFYPAIIVATIAGGRSVGIAAMLVATACAAYFFLSPGAFLSGHEVWNVGAFWIVCLIIIVLTDLLVEMLVTSTRRAQDLSILNDRLEKAEMQQSVLMRELSHRMKNQYSVILAMARATAGNTTTVAQFQKTFAARLASMSRAHDLLTQQGWEAVSLTALIRAEMQPFAEHGTFDIDGKDANIQQHAVVNIGMALHELATNAVKHGVWSRPDGRISISWTVAEDKFIFKWEELDGVDIAYTETSGFGRTLLERVVPTMLQGVSRFDYLATGLCWTLTVPRSNLIAG